MGFQKNNFFGDMRKPSHSEINDGDDSPKLDVLSDDDLSYMLNIAGKMFTLDEKVDHIQDAEKTISEWELGSVELNGKMLEAIEELLLVNLGRAVVAIAKSPKEKRKKLILSLISSYFQPTCKDGLGGGDNGVDIVRAYPIIVYVFECLSALIGSEERNYIQYILTQAMLCCKAEAEDGAGDKDMKKMYPVYKTFLKYMQS